jgi:uncharacterized protein
MKIHITIGDLTMEGTLNDTETAKAVARILPYRAAFDTWGDEIYFATPVEARLERNADAKVAEGDLGYWPPGRAFCIFFGPTPMSTPGRIVAASPVNIIGRIHGDPSRFKSVMHENEAIVEVAE